MKLQFLLGSIVVAGLLASAPNAASHGGFGGGGGFHGGGFAGFHGGGRVAGFHGRDHFFGRGRFFWSGFRFLWPTGTRGGIGIIPTIPITPTRTTITMRTMAIRTNPYYGNGYPR